MGNGCVCPDYRARGGCDCGPLALTEERRERANRWEHSCFASAVCFSCQLVIPHREKYWSACCCEGDYTIAWTLCSSCYGNIWDTMGYGEGGSGGIVTTKPTGQTKDGSVWHYGGREQQPCCDDCRLTPVEGWHRKEGEGFLCKSCFGKRGGVKS